MTSPPSIIEIGVPQISFDLGGAFLTDVEVEVHESLKLLLITFVRNLNVTLNTQGDVYRLGQKHKCHTEYSGTDCSTILDIHPLMAIKVFPVLPSLGCKGVAAALWLTLARSLTVRR
ncbi:hypothetical protein Tco_0461278 [Tanacetum coccineum]